MSFKIHQVKSYNYSFDAHTSGPGVLQLWGDLNLIAEVKFVSDTMQIPAPTFASDLNSAKVYFKHSSLPGLLDMLRNEDPVSVTINDQGAGFVFIHTGQEPVGTADS